MDNRMKTAQEEIFGPVLAVIPFKDFPEVLEKPTIPFTDWPLVFGPKT